MAPLVSENAKMAEVLLEVIWVYFPGKEKNEAKSDGLFLSIYEMDSWLLALKNIKP